MVSFQSLFYTFFAQKISVFILVSVEHIYVYLWSYARHSAVGAQLPIDQVNIGFVFAVASNPNVVVVL